jgi:WD40 repeat protein
MEDYMFCIECGENLEETAKFCSKCGVKQSVKETPEPVVTEQPKEGKFSLQFKFEKNCECAISNKTIAMSPDGKYLATTECIVNNTSIFSIFLNMQSVKVNINILDISTLKKIKQLSITSNSDRKMSIAFSPDSKYIVVSKKLHETKYDKNNQSTNIYYIPVYKIESGNIIRKLNYGSNTGIYDSFSFSPDGKRIIGTYESRPQLWEADDGQQLLQFKKKSRKDYFSSNRKKTNIIFQ